MRAANRFQSVAKFLYTQNPFYLSSWGLIFYGIHLLIPGQASLESRTLILLSGMAAYTALMSLTAVCVIRYGKVWDDARSILMIVAGMNAACLVAAGCILSQQDWQPMLHDHTWLPVPLRVACFLIAVGISFVKTGSHRPLLAYLCSRLLMREYQLGL